MVVHRERDAPRLCSSNASSASSSSLPALASASICWSQSRLYFAASQRLSLPRSLTGSFSMADLVYSTVHMMKDHRFREAAQVWNTLAEVMHGFL